MYETALVLSVVVFVTTVVIYLNQPSASVFHPATFYLMFHGLVFVIRPIFGWYYDYNNVYNAMHFTPTVWHKTEALICANLALVVFVAVSLLVVREPLRFEQDQHDLAQRRMLTERFLPIAILLGAMAAYSIYWLLEFQQSGELVAELDQRTGGRAMTATNGYFYAAGTMLASIVAMIAFLGRFTPWSLAPFVVFAMYRFATGQRGAVVTAAVMIALLYMFDRRRKWPTWPVIAAALAIVPIFNAIQTDRGATLRQAFGFEVIERDQTSLRRDEKPLESLDIAMMEMVEFLVWSIPEKSGSYDYFLGNLQILTEPIPRALWKDKPVGAPIKLFDLYSHAVTISGVMSVPGMGWMYWGYPGVVIWAAVFALIYGTGYKWFARGRQSNMAVIAYMIFLSTAVIAYRDGLLLTILKQLLFYLAPLGLLAIVARMTKLPGKDLIRHLWTAQALQAEGLPNTPVGRRRRALANQQQLAAPAHGATADTALSPRARRRARMAEL